MTTTRNLRDLAANLRHIANLFESAAVGELAEPVSLYVAISSHSMSGERSVQLVEQIATITGQPPAFEQGSTFSGDRAWLSTSLEQETWRLHCSTLAKRPDPAELLRIENEQLRAALGKIKKIAGKHAAVDGCECEDCDDLAATDG